MDRVIVDIHPHIISDDEVRYPKAPLGGVRSKWSQERPATWDELSQAMTDAGVMKAAVVQSSTTYGHDNSYLADCVDSAPGRITGVCSVGFLEDSAVEDIAYWIHKRGMSGLRLFASGSTMTQADWLADEKTWPAWAFVAEHGIPICVQVKPAGFDQLRTVLAKFPGLRMILDHAGSVDLGEGPPYALAEPLWPFSDYPDVCLKVTTRTLNSGAKSRGGAGAMLAELISRFGSDRIAWGSNWPASTGTLRDLVVVLEDAVRDLPEQDARNICGETALRLYPKLT